MPEVLKYWLVRILQSVFVLWAAFTLSFVILQVLPSDAALLRLNAGGAGGPLDEAEADALRASLGLDKPLLVQYLDRIGGFLTGDFGVSIQKDRPVADLVAQALPSTLVLVSVALILALVFGTLLAVLASGTRAGWLRQALQSIPPVVLSLPGFWVALVLIQVFAFQVRWFPSTGDKTLPSLVLPAITLALPIGAIIAQILTKSLLATWRAPFVQVAEARGLGRRQLLTRHVLRNAVIPTLTMLAIIFGNLLGGSIIVETVFGRAGLGRLTENAVTNQDIPVVQFVVVFAALVFVVTNLFVDFLYTILDPRIRRRGLA
jgi:peptide/nickel transport system permease protein